LAIRQPRRRAMRLARRAIEAWSVVVMGWASAGVRRGKEAA
jgi:hypothetical protein